MSKLFTILKRHYFSLLIIVFLIYSAILIYRSSFVVHGVRYFSLFDDMMISMRYAYNFAHGSGLTWNPGGEHIEGFTNLLWVLYMSVVHLFPIPLEKTSLVIQLTATACMVGVLFFVKKIASFISHNSYFVTFFSLLFTAFYFPLISWTVILGTEVSILTLLLSISVFLALQSIKNKKFSLLLFIVLGIGTLVRMDYLISALSISLFLIIFDKKNRKQYLLIGIPIIVGFLILQTLYRIWYYHDVLPNTYYLKMTGYPLFNRITRGIYVTLHFMNIFLLLIPFIYYYFSKNKNVLLCLFVFTGQILYNVYVGGDAEEWYGGANRFIAIAIPIFFITLIYTIYESKTVFQKTFVRFRKKYEYFTIFILVFSFLTINTAADNMIFQLLLISKPFLANENKNQVEESYALQEITKPNAIIAVTHAGGAPYFTQRYFVDILGKNDNIIAKEPSKPALPAENRLQQYISYQPGHSKWDYPYLIKRYKPDLFIEFWQRPNEDEEKYLKKEYTKMRTNTGYLVYVRNDSQNVKRDKLQPVSW